MVLTMNIEFAPILQREYAKKTQVKLKKTKMKADHPVRRRQGANIISF